MPNKKKFPAVKFIICTIVKYKFFAVAKILTITYHNYLLLEYIEKIKFLL